MAFLIVGIVALVLVGLSQTQTGSGVIDQIMSPVSQDTIRQMALAIQQQEGYSPGTRSYRNNNPGNMRPPSGKANYWTGQVGIDSGGFAIFDSYDSGFNALVANLTHHIAHNPNQSLADYIAAYAPASDGNNPDAYAAFVADQLGVDPSVSLGDLSGDSNAGA